jgi:hypothetical protein
MSIQQAIASDYYKLADMARTPEQINSLKQHIANSVTQGNLLAYEGIPLIQSLNAKVQEMQKANAIKAGLLPPEQPIGQQVLQGALAARPAPQQAPQQMAQAQAPQGIDSAESNLPQEYAGGGIVAFNGEDNDQVVYDDGASMLQAQTQPVSFADRYQAPDVSGILETLKKPGGISWFGKSEPPAAPVTPTPAPEAKTEPKAEAKKDTGIIIHDTPKKAAPSGPAIAPPSAPADTGIDALEKKSLSDREELKKLILGDSEDAKKQLGIQALLAAVRGGFKAAAGTSPYAGVNIAGGGEEFAKGLGEGIAQVQANKQRQVQQLVALGLKGTELDTELAKLGITKDYYDAHKKLFEAQAGYYGRRSGTTGTAGMGSVSSAVTKQIYDEYFKGYKNNPQSAPFFKELDKGVQKALTLPGTESYNRAMREIFIPRLNQEFTQEMGINRAYGAKQYPMMPYGAPE